MDERIWEGTEVLILPWFSMKLLKFIQPLYLCSFFVCERLRQTIWRWNMFIRYVIICSYYLQFAAECSDNPSGTLEPSRNELRCLRPSGTIESIRNRTEIRRTTTLENEIMKQKRRGKKREREGTDHRYQRIHIHPRGRLLTEFDLSSQ